MIILYSPSGGNFVSWLDRSQTDVWKIIGLSWGPRLSEALDLQDDFAKQVQKGRVSSFWTMDSYAELVRTELVKRGYRDTQILKGTRQEVQTMVMVFQVHAT